MGSIEKGFYFAVAFPRNQSVKTRVIFSLSRSVKRVFTKCIILGISMGVKANVTEECLYINIGTYLHKKEGTKIRKGEVFEHNEYLLRKNCRTFVIYLILGYTEMMFIP